MTIRCLIADDEPLGRERIAGILRTLPGAEIVAMCENGSEALEAVDALRPDLLFLDIQMPELDGFGVVAAIPPGVRPEVIFVTVHDQFALKAFEVHAQDYLLKPFDPDRLIAAFERAAARIGNERAIRPDARLHALVEEMERRRTRRTRIAIKGEGRVRLLPVGEIDWIESSDNHVRVHANGQVHVVRQTLQGIEASLAPTEFIRVHRTAIVNIARIQEIQPWFNGEFVVLLRSGVEVRTSRGYRARLEALLG